MHHTFHLVWPKLIIITPHRKFCNQCNTHCSMTCHGGYSSDRGPSIEDHTKIVCGVVGHRFSVVPAQGTSPFNYYVWKAIGLRRRFCAYVEHLETPIIVWLSMCPLYWWIFFPKTNSTSCHVKCTLTLGKKFILKLFFYEHIWYKFIHYMRSLLYIMNVMFWLLSRVFEVIMKNITFMM